MGKSTTGKGEDSTLLAVDDMRAAARRSRQNGDEEPRVGGRQADPAALRAARPIPEPQPLTTHGPARVLALCNQKGGVGKTTSTINLGAALTEYGRKVLLVDFDPQGALSVGLGVAPHQLDCTIYNLIMERGVSMSEVIMKTSLDGMDLLPSNIDLSAAEIQLVTEVGREQTLARTLQPAVGEYDYILIDC